MAKTAKIMLVEDDTNLGEIYQARMAAEGYIVVSARDGEEALALAAKEKPDLIISDVMMPKISGFEMLDILRNTEGLKDTKVIMLTALGQAEDKTRASSLGADRYLVKSQVTLEDIVKSAQELLNDEDTTNAIPTAPATTPQATPAPPTTSPPAGTTNQQVTAAPAASGSATTISVPLDESSAAASVDLTKDSTSASPTNPQPSTSTQSSSAIGAQLTPTPTVTVPPTTQSAEQENSTVQEQIASFENQTPSQPAVPASPPPTTPPTVPTPPTIAPLAVTKNPEAAADELLTNAVNDLAENAPQQKISISVPSTPNEQVITPTKNATQNESPSTPSPVPNPDLSKPKSDDPKLGDSVPVAHKKIIEPITDIEKKPDINELFAAEEAKNPTAQVSKPVVISNTPEKPAAPPPVQPPTPAHLPGNVFTPAAKNDDSNANNGVDPNSIAL